MKFGKWLFDFAVRGREERYKRTNDTRRQKENNYHNLMRYFLPCRQMIMRSHLIEERMNKHN